MARRRFFVDEIHAGHARIEGDEAHHLTRVLRVEKGQKFEISDDESVYLAEVEAAHKSLVEFVVLERLACPEDAVAIRLYASLVRFERFEVIIEKATELGVSMVIPVIAERSEKGLEQAVSKRLTRWKRIAREASEQSRRLRLPRLEEPVRFSEALADTAPYRFFLDEGEAPPILTMLPAALNATESIALLTGPEGGWTDRERAAASDGWSAVSLGPQILRAETAAVASLAIVNAWCASHAMLAS
jgi:16S rRNA (uracil1498-N3)-methyltransferase